MDAVFVHLLLFIFGKTSPLDEKKREDMGVVGAQIGYCPSCETRFHS